MMNTKILTLSLIVLFLFSGNIYSQNKQQKTVYEQAGTIKVKDPMASLVGYRKQGEDFFKISLDDVGKYSGHVCAGISSGFILVKQALEKLYPNGEVPVRGQIRVAAQNGGDQFDVASYITGARAFYGRQEVNANDLVIDKSLAGKKGTFTMVFYRKDNGKMVKAVFNKMKLMTPKEIKTIMPIKNRIEKGTATKEDKKQFAKLVHSIVEKVITNMPKGVITITECTDYKFRDK